MSTKEMLIECEKKEARHKKTIDELVNMIGHYRHIAELSPDCIFIVNRDFVVDYVNAAAARYMAKTSKQIVGKGLKKLFPPATYRAQIRHLNEAFGSGIAVTSSDRITFPDIELLLNTKWIPVRDSSGNISTVMSISRDISEFDERRERRSGKIVDTAPMHLSVRETEILHLVSVGLTSKEIANTLFISPKTVDTHRTRMMKKLDAHNTADLIRKSGMLK
jgi:PAS domain S-box-containing protein